jgi:hypothetical protein
MQSPYTTSRTATIPRFVLVLSLFLVLGPNGRLEEIENEYEKEKEVARKGAFDCGFAAS